jgi:hypothetical protein
LFGRLNKKGTLSNSGDGNGLATIYLNEDNNKEGIFSK